jgi:hypothetical protein
MLLTDEGLWAQLPASAWPTKSLHLTPQGQVRRPSLSFYLDMDIDTDIDIDIDIDMDIDIDIDIDR